MALTICARRYLLRRAFSTTTPKCNGYIVLIPEIGEDLPEKNPLLHNDGLPEFTNITIEKCMAAIAKQTINFETGVKDIETTLSQNNKPENIFEDVFKPLEELGVPLDVTWGLSKTLYLSNSTMMPTKSYLAIHNRARRARATKFYNPVIFNSSKIANDLEEHEWSEEEQRILKKFIIEGKLNGLELSEVKRAQLNDSLRKLLKAQQNYRDRVEVATNRFSHTISDRRVVNDFPEDLLKSIALDSNNYLDGPWKITLKPHIYSEVLKYCHDRGIRWNLWQAWVGRNSGFGNREFSTSVYLEEIRALRQDTAKILGYNTFADMSMETKMAGKLSTVQETLDILLERAKPAQDRELTDLLTFANERGFNHKQIELWDLPYWKRKQERSLYECKDANLKDFFPITKVLQGLFELCEKLFDVQILQRKNVATWHRDVKFYDIFETDSSAPIAGFYLDLYARDDEKISFHSNSGWMVGIQNQSKITNTKPLAALIFNFDQPINNVSCLNFKQVQSVFHKFGHSLQHLLTRTNYSEVSGTSNIEWDAVEVTGHLLSHWLFDKKVIDSITSHKETGETLPNEMFENLVKLHHHMAGTELSRELYLSALDLELYSTTDYWLEIVRKLWPRYHSFPLDKLDSHPCNFTPIFTEEWGSAYYCHVWSRMIAADVYSAFHEIRNDDERILEVGKRFRETFLALGGSCHPSKIFRQFRGRDPSPKALLRSLGLKKVVNA